MASAGATELALSINPERPSRPAACLQGFPRADVDVPAIRADRHAIISKLLRLAHCRLLVRD